ncbi:MAG: glutamate--tRNA ligase [Candidatus Micrarchaeia archaeon]
MTNINEVALKHALKNAFDFGKADLKSVVGKVIAEFPDCKKDMKATMHAISKATEKANSLTREDLKKELSNYAFKAKKPQEKKELPEFENTQDGVVMRIAPNPNGPMHIGHSRMAILNSEYVKKYNGKLILRFDDTDPKNENKIPMKEAYEWDEEDLEWLNVNYSQTIKASDRLGVYYGYFEKLLEKQNAYICTCDPEKWKKLVRFERKPCPCRKLSKEENLNRWKDMLNERIKQGDAVARIKTSLQEKNPAIIDWPAFRIVDQPKHPFVTDKKVWPLLDFAGAIDDHDFAITHILRGKDLVDSENRQKKVYEHFNWAYPKVTVYGKFIAEDLEISKSKISKGIQEGAYTGWDDPQLPTLRALRRRGILPQAIRTFILNLGISKHEVNADLEILYAENKKMIDENTKRFFFVSDPVCLKVKASRQTSTVKNHPSNHELGTRTYQLPKNVHELLISKKDCENLKDGDLVRLKELYPIKVNACSENEITAEEVEDESVKAQIIQWVVENQSLDCRVLLSTGQVETGKCEKACGELSQGTVIQFERKYFAKLDSKNNKLVFYFTFK